MRIGKIVKVAMALSTLFVIWRWTVVAAGNVTASHEYQIGKYYRFEELNQDGIRQEFTPQYNRLQSIELFIANVYDDTDGSIQIVIGDEKGNEIFRKSYLVSKIPTGEFYEYKIRKTLKPGEHYDFYISYNGNSEELPQLMVSEKTKNLVETETMYVQWEESDYNVAISYNYAWRSLLGFSY
mgnify:FL=1